IMEILFSNLQKGDPVILEIKNDQILSWKKTTPIEWEIFYTPLKSRIEVARGSGKKIKGRLIQKTKKEISFYPYVNGKLYKNIRTTIPRDEITYFKNLDKMELPPLSIVSTKEKKKNPKDNNKVIQVKVPEITPKEGEEKPNPVSGLPKEKKSKENLFHWLTNPENMDYLLGAILVFAVIISFTLYQIFKKTTAPKGGALAQSTSKAPEGSSWQGGFASETAAQGGSFFPKSMSLDIKPTQGGLEVMLQVDMMSGQGRKEDWDALFFLFNPEKPNEFRLSKQDISLAPPEGKSLRSSNPVHIFGVSHDILILPILVKTKDADLYRDRFFTDHLQVTGISRTDSTSRIYNKLKQKLLEENLPHEDIPFMG
ncbi:MAG: hypothetical protein D6785_03840, partial [Planctomycetota bacterium]